MNSPFEDEKSERLFGLIQMLQRTALVNMGGIPDHEGQIHFNLSEAKAAIDAIDAIGEKTSGNLSELEANLLRGTLSELRMIFVKAPEQQAAIEVEMKRQEELQKTFTDPATAPSEIVHTDATSEEE